jgi:hypothetical protein
MDGSLTRGEVMRLRFAHLADFAGPGHQGKLVVVGIFNRIYDRQKIRPIPFPPFYLVAVFEASLAEGSEHQVKVTIVNADERPTGFEMGGNLSFYTTGEGQPLHAVLLTGFGPQVVKVPELGDFAFVFEVDGTVVGRTDFSAIPAPKS